LDLQNHVLILVAVGCCFPLKSRTNTERSATKEKAVKELEKYWKGGVYNDITLNKLSNDVVKSRPICSW
jgi:hypothetical protein